MDWADYLRDQAAKYRQLAETAEDPSIKQELLELAAICEEAAKNIEDRMPGGNHEARLTVLKDAKLDVAALSDHT